jgi:hypothetical protein
MTARSVDHETGGHAMIDIGSDRLSANGDVFYAALLKAHDGLSAEASNRLNARLVLLLANQVGDLAILNAALDRASERPKP